VLPTGWPTVQLKKFYRAYYNNISIHAILKVIGFNKKIIFDGRGKPMRASSGDSMCNERGGPCGKCLQALFVRYIMCMLTGQKG